MIKLSKKLLFWATLAVLVLASCVHYPTNPPLAQLDPSHGYRSDLLSPGIGNSDSLLFIATFSGGGTRAAALSYGVLEALRDTWIVKKNSTHRLLDELDVISSVSGGSFTAAYYGLFREQIFEDFIDTFLYRDVERELIGLLLRPQNLYSLTSSTYARGDLAGDWYTREIFQRKTFADIPRVRPLVVLNATDITTGLEFPFIQSRFDDLCSDLDSIPVGRAVAASSSFPVVFTPITINNYSYLCEYGGPTWSEMISNIIENQDISKIEKQDISETKKQNANKIGKELPRAVMIESYHNSDFRPFIHLIDGGISDNLGVRVPIEILKSSRASESMLRKIGLGNIKKVVVLVVDARQILSYRFDRSPNPPGFLDVIDAISSLPIRRSSDTNLLEFQQTLFDLEKWTPALTEDRSSESAGFKIYPIYVGCLALYPDVLRMRECGEIPTRLRLPRSTVDSLRAMARDILETSPVYQRLLEDLRTEGQG